MIDFSWIFILYEFLQEAFGWLTPMEYAPRDLMIFGIVVAVLWGLALVIPKPKNSSKISVKRLFRILGGLGLVGLGVLSLVVYRQPIANWGRQLLGVSADTFWIIAISALLFLIGLAAFIVRRFLSKEPNNESGLNARQKLGALCALAWVLLAGYLSWMLVYPAFRGAMSALILVTEILSVLFWFYDPLIYIFSRLFTTPIKPARTPTPGKLNRFAVLGCAHNEEKVIDRLVESLYATSYPRDKYDVFVICDNCTDNTAQKVRQAGGIPMERHDEEKRGKGFALAWMFDILTQKGKQGDVYDAYIVLDADNLVNEQFLDEINLNLNKGYEILQAYLGCKNPGDTWITKCYSLAYWLSNSNYQDAHSRLGLSAQMGGTGMVIRPSVLEEVGWRTDSLTEDLVLTTNYVSTKNRSCCWVHNARLYDEKPLKLKPSIKQRTRWMQGHMEAMFQYGLPLLAKGLKNLSLRQIDVAFYLMRPFLNIAMFAVYLIRVLAIFFFPGSFMAASFFMSFDTAVNLMLVYLIMQLYVLFEEGYLRYAPWIPLQWIYTFTWYVPIFNGIVKRKEMFWVSTEHARDLSITQVREDALVAQAKKQLEGMDNLHLLPIGQLLLKATVISNRQLQEALAIQKARGGFLGDILVDTGAIDQNTLDAYLNLQQSVKAAAEQAGGQSRRMPLGQVLINSGLVTQRQIDQALQYQKENGGRVGEAFVHLGALTPEMVDIFLEFQKMLDVNYVSIDKTQALIAGMRRQDYANVGELLCAGGLVSRSQLDAALQYQSENGGEIGQILVEMGYVDPGAIELIMNAQRARR